MKLTIATALALVTAGAVLAAPAPAPVPASPVIKRNDMRAPDKAGPAGPMYTFPCTNCGHGANEKAWPPCCQSLGGTPVPAPVVKRGDERGYEQDKYDDNHDQKNCDKHGYDQGDKYDDNHGYEPRDNKQDKHDDNHGEKHDRRYDDNHDNKYDGKYDNKYADKYDDNYDNKYDNNDGWNKPSKPSDKNWNNNEPSKAGPAAPQYSFPCTRCGNTMNAKAKENAWPPCCMFSREEDMWNENKGKEDDKNWNKGKQENGNGNGNGIRNEHGSHPGSGA